jgi:hypothetical protein
MASAVDSAPASKPTEASGNGQANDSAMTDREIRDEHSHSFAAVLEQVEFQSGVEEIFAVEVLPGTRFPALSGPYPEVDGVPTTWNAPAPDHSPPINS